LKYYANCEKPATHERGGGCLFIVFLEKIVIGLSDQTDQPYWSDRLGDPNCLTALSEWKPLFWSFGLGSRLVR
jgi:hypothetical protein